MNTSNINSASLKSNSSSSSSSESSSECYRVVITGSRSWTDYRTIYQALLKLKNRTSLPVEVIQGCARGADQLAERAAVELNLSCIPYPADWNRYGKRAGVLRNLAMLSTQPQLILGFLDTSGNLAHSGTLHCLREAHYRNLPHLLFTS